MKHYEGIKERCEGSVIPKVVQLPVRKYLFIKNILYIKIRRKKVMKKLMFIPLVFFVFVLAGCSISLEPDMSKVDEFVEVAEEMEDVFSESISTFSDLMENETLSAEDQKTIVTEIDQLRESFDEFKSKDAPFLAKTAKKVAAKELNKKEEKLVEIQEKAKKGKADRDDLEKMIDILSDDIEIKVFK